MKKKTTNQNIPSYDELLIPTVKALIALGGSGSIEEINTKIYEITRLPEASLQIPHNEEGSVSEIDYRLAWSRSYLKKFGLLENSSRGVWALLKADIDVSKLDYTRIVRTVREQNRQIQKEANQTKAISEVKEEVNEDVENEEAWKESLLDVLYNITPAAFERLAQRILRESGFSQVEVTGKSGDGGIDGKGIVRISGLLSFHVIFQCKRYRGSVTPSQIRDFRGAMQGRADKGLFITTGTFTKEAVKEATRDGAPPIDLINGEVLCEKLKELKLGITTEFIEQVNIKKDWYSNL